MSSGETLPKGDIFRGIPDLGDVPRQYPPQGDIFLEAEMPGYFKFQGATGKWNWAKMFNIL